MFASALMKLENKNEGSKVTTNQPRSKLEVEMKGNILPSNKSG